MQKVINTEAFHKALADHGLNQKQLASSVGVSSQAVTNWLKGKDFPRPATLLKLATTLRLGFDQLVKQDATDQPIVAFRKKGGAKTTEVHINKASGIGMLLKPLVPYLTDIQTLRTQIASPSIEYLKIQAAATQTRSHLGIGELAHLEYGHLIGEFKKCGAVLIPVLWGAKQRHENALHIRLPKEDVTFIFLNLDTRLEDFKFWMAHELAHVYTPELATNTEEWENFADAFAGALLFPGVCAEMAYKEAMKAGADAEIHILQEHADHHHISLNTVFQQVRQFSNAAKCPSLRTSELTIHKVRNINHGELVSQALFDPVPPEPETYIADCENIFQSDFFNALKRMIHENGTGPSYIQQTLDTSLQDAHAIHDALTR